MTEDEFNTATQWAQAAERAGAQQDRRLRALASALVGTVFFLLPMGIAASTVEPAWLQVWLWIGASASAFALLGSLIGAAKE